MSRTSVVTLCDGVLPCAWQAAAISSFARRTSGCSNWPGERIAESGIAPWCAETKSISPKLSVPTVGSAARAAAERAVRLDQHVDGNRLRDAGSRRVPSMNAVISAASAALAIFGSVM